MEKNSYFLIHPSVIQRSICYIYCHWHEANSAVILYICICLDDGSTLALIFRKSWFIAARFHSIHLRAYFPQVNVTIALIVYFIGS